MPSRSSVEPDLSITVAIPAYNCASTIQRAIDSVLAQTHPQFELLIVNDGSIDSTEGILNQQTDSRIRVVHHAQNQGEGATRNTCFYEASYPWLAFLDSDDEWFPQKLQVQLEALPTLNDKENSAIFVPYERYNLDNGQRETVCETAANEAENWVRHLLDQCGIGAGSTMLINKTAFLRIGSYDIHLMRRTDHDWLLRFAHSGGKIVQLGGEPLARVYFTAKSRPEVIERSTVLFLKKHASTYATQPSAVVRKTQTTLLFQIAESYETTRQHRDWLRIMWKCMMLAPCRTTKEILGRIHRAIGRPLLHLKQFWQAPR